MLEKSLYKSTPHELWCSGDEILSINGLSVQGLSHREAISIFKTIKAGIVTIHIARRDSGLATNRCSLAILPYAPLYPECFLVKLKLGTVCYFILHGLLVQINI